MAYNQHQSFFVRDRWIGKGLRAIEKDPGFFLRKDAFEKIGLGKNMVQSLRHWLSAFELVEQEKIGKKREQKLTLLGEWILKNDPAIKQIDTIAILHYILVSKIEPASSWYWYFNINTESILSKEQFFDDLNNWIQDREARVVAERSVTRDVDCLIKMYTTPLNDNDPEDVTISPFSQLELIKELNGTVHKNEINLINTNNLFVKYILADYCKSENQFEISLEDILKKESLLGKCFNLSRSTVIDILVDLQKDENYKLKFTRTNNLDMVTIPKISQEEILINHSK